VNLHDEVPVEIGHLHERDVSKDTSVVDNNIDLSEGINSSLDDSVTEFDGVSVSNSLTTGSLNLIDDFLSNASASTISSVRHTKIVNDDLSTLGGKPQGVFSSETVSCTSDDDDSVIKSDSAHDEINVYCFFFVCSMKIFWNYIFYFGDSSLSPPHFSACNSRSLKR
jgi:hypothetical protein